ncbi:hypothetical protein PIROE2DRAFT_1091 [Piromyces sp. E2]|nr:hypothetical protein PIROE2DRAFT_1091 [Piromyces sp. E2]|eukprot:OUM70574.1 hypothetical protein PIROE2DRAFT_1091 [Piromyces sp. E2]
MIRINKSSCLFILVIYLLLINIIFAKNLDTLSNDDKIPKIDKEEDQYYLIYVENTFGEFNIFSKPKYLKRQEMEANKLVFSIVDEIHELIVENKDTFKNPEKLEEIENAAKLKKRSNSNQQYYNYGDSEYIYPISASGNTVVLLGYLSKTLSEKVTDIDGVSSVSQDSFFDAQDSHYNIQDILDEAHWDSLTVDEGAKFHLSLLSQGEYHEELVNKYDNNYYYPSSAGQGIDIIIMDNSFKFLYDEYSNKGEGQRTVKCEAILYNGRDEFSPGNEYSCGAVQYQHGQFVADSAGGLKYGAAKLANIYGIALPYDDYTKFKFSDILAGLRYILENMIKPHKTVINLSLGGLKDKDTDDYRYYEQIVNEITARGAIMVVSAGNDNLNVNFHPNQVYVPCFFNSTICVGGIDSRPEIGMKNVYKKAEDSNFGDEVDLYAPFFVYHEYLFYDKIEEGINQGTSFASPLTAGVIATIMSDHPEIDYDKESMLKHLIKNAIPFYFDNKVHYMVNNGKHIVYSEDDTYGGCDISAGMKSCKDSCPVDSCTIIDSKKYKCQQHNGSLVYDGGKNKNSRNPNYACIVTVDDGSEILTDRKYVCYYNDCIVSEVTSFEECNRSSRLFKYDMCYRKITNLSGINNNFSSLELSRDRCEQKNGIFLKNENNQFICIVPYFGSTVLKFCVDGKLGTSKDYFVTRYCVDNDNTNVETCIGSTDKDSGKYFDCYKEIEKMNTLSEQLYDVKQSYTIASYILN